MALDDGLDRWLNDLRARLRRGDLASLAPIDVGDGTQTLPGEDTIKIMLADLDHLQSLPAEAHAWVDYANRRRDLMDRFRRLRALLE